MIESLPPSWHARVSVAFVASTAALCVRYLLVTERVPNYGRVLNWIMDWWR